MASTLSLKDRISSPLEAGTSIADGHYLPARLSTALEYAAKRLARKGTHVTLLVVRRDYQLPTSPLTSPCAASFGSLASASAPGSAANSVASTPSRPTFSLSQLVRSYSSTVEAPIRERILSAPLEHFRNDCASPAFSETSMTSGSTASTASTAESTFSSRRLRWPTSPAYSSVPMTPATPFTVASSSVTASTDTSSAVSGPALQNPSQFGIKLVHMGSTGPRDEKVLSQTIEKTSRKFKLGAHWLPQAVSPATLDLPTDVVHRSLAQYEVLFTSEYLTLLSLDHLYNFRTALQSYARIQASSRLEDAVDELRRLFLANGRKKLLKSNLLSAYRWLDPVSDAALSDVCRMYSRAYGGLDLETGVENDIDSAPSWPLPSRDSTRVHEPSVADEATLPELVITSSHPQHEHSDELSFQLSRQSPPLIRAETPQWGLAFSPEEKEFLFSRKFDEADMDDIDELDEDLAAELKELDAIEAWYRDVQIDVDVVDVGSMYGGSIIDVAVQPPPPPPPPIMHIGLSTNPAAAVIVEDSEIEDDESIIESEMQLEERRTTPKMASAPPPPPMLMPMMVAKPVAVKPVAVKPVAVAAAAAAGRNMMPLMNLRLQTTFDAKPKLAKRRSPTQNGDLQRQGLVVPDQNEEEEDEDLTARPKSAIISPGMQWNIGAVPVTPGGLQSIDGIVGTPGGMNLINNRVQALQQHQQHVGPMTPNGYDDISPITRGEWGFFKMGSEFGRNNGRRKVAVEMC
ncbi:hypothetical protein B0H66DRAFT_607082 [Apodospora peruviana]|uniref:DUF7582 domain-containing protein n=1 Tax=Apodospora peruviana TaxID=516989 RepID=A0AAE0HVU1_9PEZI|nr:hypothetical protein B0H66DRAFT_607082 [Apodospora peruviana]